MIVIYLSRAKKFINLKQDPRIAPYPLCLGNISEDFSPSDMCKTRLNGYVYDFSVDYWAISNDKILDIHKYLMKKKSNII